MEKSKAKVKAMWQEVGLNGQWWKITRYAMGKGNEGGIATCPTKEGYLCTEPFEVLEEVTKRAEGRFISHQ